MRLRAGAGVHPHTHAARQRWPLQQQQMNSGALEINPPLYMAAFGLLTLYSAEPETFFPSLAQPGVGSKAVCTVVVLELSSV